MLYAGNATADVYPSDHFTVADSTTLTGLRLSVDSVLGEDPFVKQWPATLGELDALDGFSTVGGVYVRFSDEIDWTTLSALAPDAFTEIGAPIALVNVATGRPIALVPEYFSSNTDPNAPPPDFMLVVQPAAPLDPKARYVFVVSDTLKTASGGALEASAATVSLVSGTAEGDYGTALRAALPAVAQATGITADHVVLATMFTTESIRDDTIAVAKAARASAPPSGGAPPTLQKQSATPGDNRIRFQGTFPAPEYRGLDGMWHDDASGVPIVQSTAQLQYFLAFSDATHSGPRPIVVFAHGLGQDKDETWDVAQYLASLDVAVIGIDAPDHGSRANPPFPPGQTDEVTSTMAFVGVNLNTYSLDAGMARDNFRQMASDQLELFRFVESLGSLDVLPLGAPDGVPDVDPTRVVYLGESFGAVLGSTALALGPEAHAACLTVGGDDLALILRDSQTFKFLLRAIDPPGVDQEQLARFIVAAQSLVDRGDPINYAAFVNQQPLDGVPGWRGTDVLLQEVKDDTIIPNDATSGLARALGLSQVQPVVMPIAGLQSVAAPMAGNGPGGVTAGVFQFDQAGGAPAQHTTIMGTPEAIKQYTAFFQSALSSPHPQIVNAY